METVIKLGLIGGIVLGTLFTLAVILLNWWPESTVFKAFAQQHHRFVAPLPKHIGLPSYLFWLLFHFALGFVIGLLIGCGYTLVRRYL